MFKIIIKNEKRLKETNNEHGQWSAVFDKQELADKWLSDQIGKPHRLPEREIDLKEDIPQEEIKEIKEIVIDNDGEKPIIKKVAILKAEFTYEIKNLNEDEEFLKEQAISNRLKEYPSQFELNEAFYALLEKNEEKVAIVLAKKKAVDEKYPLPDDDIKNIKGVH